jgi:hypothetical protein
VEQWPVPSWTNFSLPNHLSEMDVWQLQGSISEWAWFDAHRSSEVAVARCNLDRPLAVIAHCRRCVAPVAFPLGSLSASVLCPPTSDVTFPPRGLDIAHIHSTPLGDLIW